MKKEKVDIVVYMEPSDLLNWFAYCCWLESDMGADCWTGRPFSRCVETTVRTLCVCVEFHLEKYGRLQYNALATQQSNNSCRPQKMTIVPRLDRIGVCPFIHLCHLCRDISIWFLSFEPVFLSCSWRCHTWQKESFWKWDYLIAALENSGILFGHSFAPCLGPWQRNWGVVHR